MAADAHVGDLRARGAELILAAFAKARESGKPEWQVMTTAVLKNRLLDLTDGAFQQADWGATTFGEFVRQFPDIVALDSTTRPPTVRLLESAEPVAVQEAPSLLPLGPQRRIRADLWRAVLDFSGDEVYLWDHDTAIGVPSDSLGTDDPRPILPTVARQEFAAWRAEFVTAHADVPPPVLAALETWKNEGLGTRSLPARFRNVWTAEVKRRVLERLIAWFSEHDLKLPDDLVETREPLRPPEPDVERLREFVILCVQAMTQEELEALCLPASVLARTRR